MCVLIGLDRTDSLGWLASGARDPPLFLPSTGLQACTTMPGFSEASVGWVQVLVLVSRHTKDETHPAPALLLLFFFLTKENRYYSSSVGSMREGEGN